MCRWGSEFPDEPNLRLQPLTELLEHALLGVCDERANIASRRVPKVHHDIRVDVRNLRVANAKSLQATLVNQSPCTPPFDLLEDRAGARVNFEPRVTCTTPAQVLLHDAMHR